MIILLSSGDDNWTLYQDQNQVWSYIIHLFAILSKALKKECLTAIPDVNWKHREQGPENGIRLIKASTQCEAYILHGAQLFLLFFLKTDQKSPDNKSNGHIYTLSCNCPEAILFCLPPKVWHLRIVISDNRHHPLSVCLSLFLYGSNLAGKTFVLAPFCCMLPNCENAITGVLQGAPFYLNFTAQTTSYRGSVKRHV